MLIQDNDDESEELKISPMYFDATTSEDKGAGEGGGVGGEVNNMYVSEEDVQVSPKSEFTEVCPDSPDIEPDPPIDYNYSERM